MTLALSILTADIFGNEVPADTALITIQNPSRIFNKTTALLQRSDCESDLNYLQIIPYITLYDPNICCFFIYQRGNKGGEDRLHGRCSLGLGGHVEVQPKENDPDDFINILTLETSRELFEETGLTVDDIPLDKIKNAFLEENFGLIHCRQTNVDKVHLGLSLVFQVDHSLVTKTEENVISKGQWLTIGEIYEKAFSGEIELESWSKIVLQTINLQQNLGFPNIASV